MNDFNEIQSLSLATYKKILFPFLDFLLTVKEPAFICAVYFRKMCNFVYTITVCIPDGLLDACFRPSSPHPPYPLRSLFAFPCFWVPAPIHQKCRLPSSVLFLICSFWFLLSALLTCFVSFFPFCFLSAIQYLQMKWPLLDVQPGGLQSRQALKDARSPSPAHIVVSNTLLGTFPLSPALPPLFMTERQTNPVFLLSSILKTS